MSTFTSKYGTVYVGMSGGVDSSTTAALLKKEGYSVVGVFIKVWEPPFLEKCTWREDRRDAMRVCAHLDIPFKTLDLEEEYKKGVVDYMIEEYKRGNVPNPDVMCNKHVKFGAFYKWASEQGANYVATGHYARTQKNFKFLKGRDMELLRGKDTNKDQSYFLWTLTQDQLAHTLFPLGNLKKEKTREYARSFGLPVAEKKDSQGLCFLGKVDMKEFLSHYTYAQKGEVLNIDGEVIGEHEEALFYTRGQRHGFRITKKTPEDAPYYVVEKNMDTNTITVAHEELVETYGEREVLLENTNWISGEPKEGKKYSAQIRYRQTPQRCRVHKKGDQCRVAFEESQLIPSGQSVVVYDGDMCMGGGTASL